MSDVLANGELIPIDEYENNPNRFAKPLADAKSIAGHALCRCQSPHPKLVIRRVHKKHGDTYLLATWPFQGGQHAKACRFHVSEASYKAGAGQRLAAVQVSEDGFTIKPGFSMRRISAGAKPALQDTDMEIREQAIRPGRASLGLLGTLYYLWETAALNRFAARAQRGWPAVFSHLNNVVAQGSLGKTKLAELLYLVPPFQSDLKFTIDETWQSFTESKRRSDKSVPMFLILGEIKSAGPSRWSVSTMLRHHKVPIFMAHDIAQVVAKRYPQEEAAIAAGDPLNRVVGLFLVELSDKGHLSAQNAALMLCSRDYIPCDSSYEVRLANAMASQGKTFEKPMFMDSELGMLPDFIDRTQHQPVFMEVWGMKTKSYIDRKQEKIQAYAEKGLRLWQWHAADSATMPPLP